MGSHRGGTKYGKVEMGLGGKFRSERRKKEKGRGKAGRARNGTPLLGKAPHWVATVNHLQVDY
jgi:hypothetical protein